MKIFASAALAASLLVAAAPAAAQDFSGPRVAGTVGIAGQDVGGFNHGKLTYGVNAGYDHDFGKAVVGGSVEWQDSEDNSIGRDLSATLRVGGKVSDRTLFYVLGGYTNLSANTSSLIGTDIKLDGARVGAGVEFRLGGKLFLNVEERYSNYELGVDGWQTVAGLGIRF
jgi:outer membrane immunogenic protein